MKMICLLKVKTGKRLNLKVSDATWNMLAIYKVFWPPDTKVTMGGKKIPLKEIFPWPPAENSKMFEIAPTPKVVQRPETA